MRPLNFKRQIILGLLLAAAGYVLAFALDMEFLINLGWMGAGLLFVLNPVVPEVIRYQFEDKSDLIGKVFGVALIAGGWISTAFLTI